MAKRGRRSSAELAVAPAELPPLPASGRSQPKPPPHLSKEISGWWRSVVSDFELAPHHMHLLRMACEAWDMGQAARESLRKNGLTFLDDKGRPKARPECGIARDNRVLFCRILRELCLDDAASPGSSRPPPLRGY
jgi:P27 family predicted phage terminase small subunit